ncbi:MAG TPA: MotA/TolQ/ExbB proton channel family protein [Victivallales bacterium]|nr:MotA/TolQ/ExbB proton channel family protein [Victivallales bacterium]
MINRYTKFKKWLIRVVGLLLGIVIFRGFDNGINFDPLLCIQIVYQKVGVTIIALIPLAIWAVYSSVRAKHGDGLTLAYIGATAQRIGLLGTVIGIVAATVTIGDSLSSGAATAVTGALPAVGQALVSTAVGFVIAIVCDFFIYINSKDSN